MPRSFHSEVSSLVSTVEEHEKSGDRSRSRGKFPCSESKTFGVTKWRPGLTVQLKSRADMFCFIFCKFAVVHLSFLTVVGDMMLHKGRFIPDEPGSNGNQQHHV